MKQFAAKKYFKPHEYETLLTYCVQTTNMGEKTESILRTICQRYYCRGNISAKQYDALHNIAVLCVDTHPGQHVLRHLNFEGDPVEVPWFVYRNFELQFPNTPDPVAEQAQIDKEEEGATPS